MKRFSKSRSQRIHAKRRLIERYGIELNRHELRQLIATISPDTFVYSQTNRVSIHALSYGDKTLIAVYDKHRHTIASFLPNPDNLSSTPDITRHIESYYRTHKFTTTEESNGCPDQEV